MNIGIYGGTFDPVHKGHINILNSAAENGFFDKILVIPSAVPPKKSNLSVSIASYRYEMVRISLINYNFKIPVILSDIEIKRRKKSYTLDTVKEIKKSYNDECNVFIICGSDLLFEIESWHKPIELLNNAGLFVAIRPGHEGEELDKKIKYLKNKYFVDIKIFQTSKINISSKQLREMFYNGKNEFLEFMDPNVSKWVIQNAIYNADYDYSKLIFAEQLRKLSDYEAKLREYIKEDRLIHSLNTMRESIRLAKLNNLNIYKCAVAGLLHDCAKNQKNNISLPDTPKEILHSYAGSEYAKKIFKIEDEDILQAIKYHTTCRKNASDMEKLIFVADKIEPARKFTGINEIRKVAYKDLNKGCYLCLKDIIFLLLKAKKDVHPDTLEAYNELKKIYD